LRGLIRPVLELVLQLLLPLGRGELLLHLLELLFGHRLRATRAVGIHLARLLLELVGELLALLRGEALERLAELLGELLLIGAAARLAEVLEGLLALLAQPVAEGLCEVLQALSALAALIHELLLLLERVGDVLGAVLARGLLGLLEGLLRVLAILLLEFVG